jgi:hypothetical protein
MWTSGDTTASSSTLTLWARTTYPDWFSCPSLSCSAPDPTHAATTLRKKIQSEHSNPHPQLRKFWTNHQTTRNLVFRNKQ